MNVLSLFALFIYLIVAFEGCSGLSFLRTTSSDVSPKINNNKLPSLPDKNTAFAYSDRRVFLGFTLGAPSVIVALLTFPSPASARDERLFRPNPLTNPILEQLRIWEQAEADNIKYDGELEKGDAGNKGKVNAYPMMLVPILKIDQELDEVKTLVRSGNGGENNNKPSKEAMSKALIILQRPSYDKVVFKKTFNKYSDNIYYSDPDRANMYLGGGATPKTEQSIAYLLRNDILTNMENLRAELEYLIKNEDEIMDDLYTYADIVTSAMKKYLAQVPPNELKEAQKLLLSSS